MNEELSYHFIFQPNENLNLIGTRQPFLGRRLPFGKPEPTRFAIPRDRFIVHQFAVPIPQCGPLCSRRHLIVGENGTKIRRRIFKNSRGFKLCKTLTISSEL